MRLHTVTLSTGFDELVSVTAARADGVGALVNRRIEASGKGISAGRVATALGLDTTVHALVGTADISQYTDSVAGDGLDHRLHGVPGRQRRNLTVIETDSNKIATHFRADVPRADFGPGFESLCRGLDESLEPGDLLSFNGSVPSGLDQGCSLRIVDIGAAHGARVVVDSYGAALSAALRGPVEASAPNLDETSVLGAAPNAADWRSRADAALRSMAGDGVRFPMVTLGPEGVAFLDADARAMRTWARVEDVKIVVCAGDAFLAGICRKLADHAPARVAAAFGVAVAAEHVSMTPRSELAAATQRRLAHVEVEALE